MPTPLQHPPVKKKARRCYAQSPTAESAADHPRGAADHPRGAADHPRGAADAARVVSFTGAVLLGGGVIYRRKEGEEGFINSIRVDFP